MSDPDAPIASVDAPPSLSDEQRLIDYLRERDQPCPQCGYNLRNLSTPRCPACGERVRLSIALVEPYLHARIALLTAVGCGAGMGVFFVIAIVLQGWWGESAGVAIALLIPIAMIPVLPFVLVRRRWFLRLGRETQRTLAGLAIAAF